MVRKKTQKEMDDERQEQIIKEREKIASEQEEIPTKRTLQLATRQAEQEIQPQEKSKEEIKSEAEQLLEQRKSAIPSTTQIKTSPIEEIGKIATTTSPLGLNLPLESTGRLLTEPTEELGRQAVRGAVGAGVGAGIALTSSVPALINTARILLSSKAVQSIFNASSLTKLVIGGTAISLPEKKLVDINGEISSNKGLIRSELSLLQQGGNPVDALDNFDNIEMSFNEYDRGIQKWKIYSPLNLIGLSKAEDAQINLAAARNYLERARIIAAQAQVGSADAEGLNSLIQELQ